MSCSREAQCVATEYVHPREKIGEDFVEQMALVSNGVMGVIGGDFNATHTDYAGHSDSDAGKELKRIMELNNLDYVPNEQITHFARRDGDRDDVLDVAFLNCYAQSKMTNYGVLDSRGSDHMPLFIELEFSTKTNP